MKVVFMGTPDFAVGTLEALIESEDHEVVLVVTQPDRDRGRGKGLSFSPVKEVAVKHNIPVFQPERIKRPENVEELRKYPADVFVVVAFGQILSKEILEMPKFGCVNVHASILPKYRGAAPIQWAVLNGDEKTGVTTMKMDEGLDTGDMIMVSEYVLSPDETAGSLFDRLSGIGAETLLKTLKAISDGSAVYTKQNHEEASKVSMISKDMGRIDFNRPAIEVERHVRGMNPWPSAFTSINGKSLKIWKAAVVSGSGEPGQIISTDKDSFTVATGKGALKVTEVQLEGKKRMEVKDFLRGYQLELGSRLGENDGY